MSIPLSRAPKLGTPPARWKEILESLLARRKAILAGADSSAANFLDDSMVPSAEVLLRLSGQERRELSQVLGAIGRILRDEYGTCEACEKEIPSPYLQQLPYARFCPRCL